MPSVEAEAGKKRRFKHELAVEDAALLVLEAMEGITSHHRMYKHVLFRHESEGQGCMTDLLRMNRGQSPGRRSTKICDYFRLHTLR